ncbi:MAG: hypothetical protein IPG67_05900 [Acidobacteria bacterium]|nr:hypothetical protein [Acidobacteriota bacterium]
MPITIVVLGYLWQIFTSDNTSKSKNGNENRTISPLLVGILAGMLPLIHLHSLVTLFVVTGFLFIFKPVKWREWIAFGVGVCLIAVAELLWSLSGSASETSKFFDWHFGWDKRDVNVVWFWIKNTGIVIPVLIAGGWIFFTQGREAAKARKTEDQNPNAKNLLLFCVPFIFLFVVSNVAKLAPWEWDNIKVLIYWYVGSVPLIAYAIAWAWKESKLLQAVAAVGLLALTFSGGLDVWRTATGQNKIKVFDPDAVKIAQLIKEKTAPNSLFLNAPTYNSAVVLSGRLSYMPTSVTFRRTALTMAHARTK